MGSVTIIVDPIFRIIKMAFDFKLKQRAYGQKRNSENHQDDLSKRKQECKSKEV